jgi:hypothetical protein
MNNKWVLLGAVALGAVLGATTFKRTVVKQLPPRIVTQHDTVRQIDTLWKVQWRDKVKHDTVNVVEKVTVTVPETVQVVPKLTGLTSLIVGTSIKDSTLMEGFTIQPAESSKVAVRRWVGQYYTSGPLSALFVDSVPPQVHFGTFPEPPRCSITNGGLSYAGKGAAVVEILRIVFGHP